MMKKLVLVLALVATPVALFSGVTKTAQAQQIIMWECQTGSGQSFDIVAPDITTAQGMAVSACINYGGGNACYSEPNCHL